ncbi:basic proline-rich protein-like [Canis lupus familiaris]|uniref:basic proline-rich protein-like n=1 Tax=Canis lupus familiaris TaxID=9615 RepID=UPI0018F3722D|nr:basic proline-rich protein-like [Canis lupus familiaris]
MTRGPQVHSALCCPGPRGPGPRPAADRTPEAGVSSSGGRCLRGRFTQQPPPHPLSDWVTGPPPPLPAGQSPKVSLSHPEAAARGGGGCPREPEHVPEARGRPSQHRGLCLWARGACPAPETPAVLGARRAQGGHQGPRCDSQQDKRPPEAGGRSRAAERVGACHRGVPCESPPGGRTGGTSPEQDETCRQPLLCPCPRAPPTPAGPPPPGLCPRAWLRHPLPPPLGSRRGGQGSGGGQGGGLCAHQREPLPQGGRSPPTGEGEDGVGQAGAPGWGPGSREPAATQPGGRQLPRGAPPGCGYGKGFLAPPAPAGELLPEARRRPPSGPSRGAGASPPPGDPRARAPPPWVGERGGRDGLRRGGEEGVRGQRPRRGPPPRRAGRWGPSRQAPRPRLPQATVAVQGLWPGWGAAAGLRLQSEVSPPVSWCPPCCHRGWGRTAAPPEPTPLAPGPGRSPPPPRPPRQGRVTAAQRESPALEGCSARRATGTCEERGAQEGRSMRTPRTPAGPARLSGGGRGGGSRSRRRSSRRSTGAARGAVLQAPPQRENRGAPGSRRPRSSSSLEPPVPAHPAALPPGRAGGTADGRGEGPERPGVRVHDSPPPGHTCPGPRERFVTFLPAHRTSVHTCPGSTAPPRTGRVLPTCRALGVCVCSRCARARAAGTSGPAGFAGTVPIHWPPPCPPAGHWACVCPRVRCAVCCRDLGYLRFAENLPITGRPPAHLPALALVCARVCVCAVLPGPRDPRFARTVPITGPPPCPPAGHWAEPSPSLAAALPTCRALGVCVHACAVCVCWRGPRDLRFAGEPSPHWPPPPPHLPGTGRVCARGAVCVCCRDLGNPRFAENRPHHWPPPCPPAGTAVCVHAVCVCVVRRDLGTCAWRNRATHPEALGAQWPAAGVRARGPPGRGEEQARAWVWPATSGSAPARWTAPEPPREPYQGPGLRRTRSPVAPGPHRPCPRHPAPGPRTGAPSLGKAAPAGPNPGAAGRQPRDPGASGRLGRRFPRAGPAPTPRARLLHDCAGHTSKWHGAPEGRSERVRSVCARAAPHALRARGSSGPLLLESRPPLVRPALLATGQLPRGEPSAVFLPQPRGSGGLRAAVPQSPAVSRGPCARLSSLASSCTAIVLGQLPPPSPCPFQIHLRQDAADRMSSI